MDFLKGYRTVILNAVSAFVMFGIGFNWIALGISTEAAAFIILGLNVANIALRFVTDTPVGKSE